MTEIRARDCENATSFTAYKKVLLPKNGHDLASIDGKQND
jgi:hypothetical protein